MKTRGWDKEGPRRGFLRKLAFLTIFLGAVGCGPGEDPAVQVLRTDSAGVEVVLNVGPDRYSTVYLEKVFSLGGAGEGNEAFFRVEPDGLSFDAKGNIAVLDAGNRRVQIFDSLAAFVRSIGREGEGPGEFRYPSALALADNGEILVFDAVRRVGALFDSLGALIRQAPSPRGLIGGRIGLFGDTLLYSSRRLHRETGVHSFHLTWVTASDTLDLVRIPLPETRSVTYETCGISISLPPLFSVDPSWDTRGSILIVSHPPAYEIQLFVGGEERMRIRRDLAPSPASRADALEELGEGERWQVGSGPECVVDPETVIEARGIAEHIPLVAKVALSWDGGIWAQRKIPGVETGPVDVFDSSGTYRGTLPAGTPWPAAFGPGRRILVLKEDSRGVQRVVGYRVALD